MRTKLNLVKGISLQDLPDISLEPGEGFVALDPKGRVLHLSPEAEELLACASSELEGQDFFAVSQFALKDVSSLGTGSCCPALNSVCCPHLNTRAELTLRDRGKLSVDFMLTTLFEQGRVAGKLFVFKVLEDQHGTHHPHEIVESAASIIVRIDADGCVRYSNQHGRWLLGDVAPEDLLPEAVRILLEESPEQLDQQTLLDRRWVPDEAKEVCIAWSVAVTRDAHGDVTGAVCIGNDFTDHHHSLMGRRQERLMVQKVFEHISDGVITVDDDGNVEYLNPIAEQLTGWTNEQAQGKPLKEVYHVVDEKSLEPADDPLARIQGRSASNEQQNNRVLLRRGGWEFIVEDTATPLHDADGNVVGAVVVFADVSEIRGLERWLAYESSHDPLTGLINRRRFEERVREALDSARDEFRQHALIHMDLDQFKLINDSYGHVAGDQLLKEVSALLMGHLDGGDSLARLGGDEFGIILEDCPLDTARETARELCRAVRDYRFVWNDKPFAIAVSIGLVPVTDQWSDLAEVMRVADSACHVAKEQGCNRVHVFQAEDLALRQRDGQIRWIERIRHAFNEDRFRLYCQNIVPLSSGSGGTPHYEILLRMVDREGNVVRPSGFIAAAERYHLMPTIDRWVVTNALRLLAERRDRAGIFSINISGQSLDDEEFLSDVVGLLEHYDVPSENICFEITETAAASSLVVVRRFMSVLREMGCKFALDDFGRGVSSFAYLKNLSVDYLKIDGMFVRNLVEDKVGYAMVESINKIGHVMGVQTIAEFVESQAVLQKLIDLGVDLVQGYELGRPRPLMPAYQGVGRIH